MMEWEAQELQQQPQHHNQNQNGVVVGGGSGGLYVKVMTDEQMELLRRQISVYATICEQLVEMHKAITTQQDLAGLLPSLLLPLDFFFFVCYNCFWVCIDSPFNAVCLGFLVVSVGVINGFCLYSTVVVFYFLFDLWLFSCFPFFGTSCLLFQDCFYF